MEIDVKKLGYGITPLGFIFSYLPFFYNHHTPSRGYAQLPTQGLIVLFFKITKVGDTRGLLGKTLASLPLNHRRLVEFPLQ